MSSLHCLACFSGTMIQPNRGQKVTGQKVTIQFLDFFFIGQETKF